MARCCAHGSTTRIPARHAPWRRSIASSRAARVAGRCSTISGGSPRCSDGCGRAAAGADATARGPGTARARSPPGCDFLYRHAHGRRQAGAGAVAEHDAAAVGAGDVARDRETEPGAALVLIARIVEPEKRLEHFLAHGRGNPGAVVVDRDGKPAMIAMPGDRDRSREPRRI